MSAKTDTTEIVTEDEAPVNSKKREVTAAITSTTVTVLLGLASGAAINAIGARVRNVIAPQPTE